MIQSWAALSSSFPESPEPFTTEATEEHREANPKSLNTEEWREQRTEEAFSRELTRTNTNNAGVTNDKSFVFGVDRGVPMIVGTPVGRKSKPKTLKHGGMEEAEDGRRLVANQRERTRNGTGG